MAITVEAVYENGTLKPSEPLPLQEHEKVRLTITPVCESEDPLARVIGVGDSGRTDGAQNHDKYIYHHRSPSWTSRQ
jgi:predicted DNA-binding antitoxin AbrB/MazE fold protein